MGLFDWLKPKSSKTVSRPAIQEKPDIQKTSFIKKEKIYIPDMPKAVRIKVPHIELTYAQAYEQGWHYKIKSRKRIRMTRYTGAEKDIIIPARIGDYIVNEMRSNVFYKANIDSVKIPDTVKKIGSSCFRQSTVRSIIMDDGVCIIPKSFAFSCQLLEHVHLPATVCRIESCAFESCKKLRYIEIPPNCMHIEHSAFMRSGLEGFAYCDHSYTKISGQIFEFTPLEEKYKLILRAAPDHKNGYQILLVGKHADGVRLSGGKVCLGERSLLSGYRRMGTLDFSRCSEIDADMNACQLNRHFDGSVNQNADCKIVVPSETRGVYFPETVNVVYPDGRRYDGYYPAESKSADQIMLWTQGALLPSYSILCKKKTVYIHTLKWAVFQNHAVCSKHIEHITFSSLHRGEGELFAPCCESLHCVEWDEMIAWIPSSELVGKLLHGKLLKAFTVRIVNGIVYKFDGSVIDRLFSDYNSQPAISQRQRILIAADVLRSTGFQFQNREMYSRYLQTHRRYALLLSNELPQEYADFLNIFYSDPA